MSQIQQERDRSEASKDSIRQNQKARAIKTEKLNRIINELNQMK
jgi:hypothetical protein